MHGNRERSGANALRAHTAYGRYGRYRRVPDSSEGGGLSQTVVDAARGLLENCLRAVQDLQDWKIVSKY